MRFYDSIVRDFVEFQPVEDKEVILYACGLTPYDEAHIGHARTYVAFDVIKRYLRYKGYSVFHIQNITDVDDKIINRCKQNGSDPKMLTEKNHSEALELFDRLNIIRADAYPKVTENIDAIISLIKKIIEKGYAYETATGVYFDVSRFQYYGRLSGQKMEEIMAGARKEVDETKNSPEDFALWKKTSGEIIEFHSPWGTGRPGWHIECSAIALKYSKGRTIDIHGGARDLIFPHHENEIAQSEAATGNKFSKYWLHTGFLTVNGEKMSKSLGNFITVKNALQKFHPMALRIFYLKSHYRSPVDYSEKSVMEAGEVYEKIANAIDLLEEALAEKNDCGQAFSCEKATAAFYGAMENDFDTPMAFSALFNLIHLINSEVNKDLIDKNGLVAAKEELNRILEILGIRMEKKKVLVKNDVVTVAKRFGIKESDPEKAIELLISMREKARKKKNFGLSDDIRARLKEIGVILEDKKEGARWRLE